MLKTMRKNLILSFLIMLTTTGGFAKFYFGFKDKIEKEKIKLKKACSFNEKIKINGYDCSPPPSELYSILGSIYRSASVDENLALLYISEDVQYAVTGKNELNRLCVIVNTDFADGLTWPTTAVLSHEIGHIFNRHLDDTFPLSRNNELSADKFTGGTLEKLHCPDVNIAFDLYSSLIPDDVHPPFKERVSKVNEGFNEAKFSQGITFNEKKILKVNGEEEILKRTYKEIFSDKKVDLFFIVSPYNRKFDKVYMQLVNRELNITNEQFVSSIKYVEYHFDKKTFRHPDIISKNVNNDNFGYLLKVWGEFPIKADIHFIDGTIIQISKYFILPNN